MDVRADPQLIVRDLESRAERFETPCGAGRLAWHRWGKGPAVVLLHGGSGSWLHWLPTIPALEQHFTVWTPDFPGMGGSDMPPEPHPNSFEAYASIVEQGFRKLTSESADVVGFSFGTSFASWLAPRLGARHAVLSGSNYVGINSGRGRSLRSLRRATTPEERAQAVRHNLMVMMIAHEGNADPLAVHLYDVDTARRRLPRGWWDTVTVVHAELPKVRGARVTAIQGSDDHVAGHGDEAQEKALHALKPDARYVGLAGAGHWVMYEAAGRYNEELLKALQE